MEDTPDPPSTPIDGTESLYRSSSTDESRSHSTVANATRTLTAFASGAPFIALIAAVEALIATVLLGLTLTPAPLVVALVTFAVYTVDHVADADADARSTPERAALAHRYADQLMIAAALAYGLAVAIAVVGGPLALGVTLVPGAFWVLYASNWLPSVGRLAGAVGSGTRARAVRRRVPRLKEVVILNSVVVALGWAVAVTVLPIAFAGSSGGPLAVVVFAYFFLRSFVDAELPNVRDIDADAAVGVATLPVAIGVAATRRALYGVDTGAAVIVGASVALGLLAWPFAVALLAGIAVSMGVTGLAGRIDDASLLGVAPDCSYLVVGGVLVGVQLIG